MTPACKSCGYTESHDPNCPRPKDKDQRTPDGSVVTPASDRLLRQAWAWLDSVADHGSEARLETGDPTSNSVYMRRLATEIDEFLSAAPVSATPAMTFSHAQAVCILKVRDALLVKDFDEAYHWLYTLDSKQVPHDPFKPWAELEALATADSTTKREGEHG